MRARGIELTDEELLEFESDKERLQFLNDRKQYGNYIAYMLLKGGRCIKNEKEVAECSKRNG